MKKWSVIIAVTMALVMLVLSPLSALAEEDTGSATESRIPLQGALAIVAPRIAMVNQETQMTVFLRADQEPFEGAGVWAISRDNAEVFKEQLSALREDTAIQDGDKDYEALADIHGTFIGRSDPNGRVYHEFTEAGNYLLIAFSRGYFPGATWIAVRGVPRVLAIDAPDRAGVGEAVTMNIHLRGTSEPVAEAGIWAITREQVDTLREQVSALRQNDSITEEEKDYEALVGLHGTRLGQTDLNGNLTHSFDEEGFYLLVTVKRGYFPGFSGIGIRNTAGALALIAPQSAVAGTEVTVATINRITLDPVAEAAVWAIGRDQVEAFRDQAAALREESGSTAKVEDYEAVLGLYGTLLGWTDGNGRLSHTFDQPGLYILVTVKQGYFPGSAPINIRDASLTDGATTESATPDSTEIIN
ncbi:MAG TPA: hypothetical protein G4O07_07750 [Dehalococcoidia bacterium]|nr:hypothetical protein [Dehalococcoidia bacterium]